jgi:hypothetical protein
LFTEMTRLNLFRCLLTTTDLYSCHFNYFLTPRSAVYTTRKKLSDRDITSDTGKLYPDLIQIYTPSTVVRWRGFKKNTSRACPVMPCCINLIIKTHHIAPHTPNIANGNGSIRSKY